MAQLAIAVSALGPGMHAQVQRPLPYLSSPTPTPAVLCRFFLQPAVAWVVPLLFQPILVVGVLPLVSRALQGGRHGLAPRLLHLLPPIIKSPRKTVIGPSERYQVHQVILGDTGLHSKGHNSQTEGPLALLQHSSRELSYVQPIGSPTQHPNTI